MRCNNIYSIVKSILLFTISISPVFIHGKSESLSPQIGESYMFWVKDQGFFSGYHQSSATLNAIGENCYVFTEDALVRDIAVSPYNSSVLVATTNSGIFVSKDAGFTWESSNGSGSAVLPEEQVENLVNVPEVANQHRRQIHTIAFEDSLIWWVGTKGAQGIYQSVDGGNTWKNKKRGLDSYDGENPDVYKVYIPPEGIGPYIATKAGLYYKESRFTNLGTGFPDPTTSDWPSIPVYDVSVYDTLIIAATEHGLYRGSVSEQFGDKLPIEGGTVDVNSSYYDKSSQHLVLELVGVSSAGVELTVGKSVNVKDDSTGTMWKGKVVRDPRSGLLIVDLSNEQVYHYNSNLFDPGVPDSTTYANYNANNLIVYLTGNETVTDIAINSNGLVYYATSSGVYSVDLSGDAPTFLGLSDVTVNDLALSADESTLFAATTEGLQRISLGWTIYWSEVTPRINTLNTGDSLSHIVNSIAVVSQDTIYIGCGTSFFEDPRIVTNRTGGVLVSYDGGNSWTPMNIGLTHRSSNQDDVKSIVATFDSTSAAYPEKGLYEVMTTWFGSTPDIDGDGRVIILVADMDDNAYNTTDDLVIKGYFNPVDQLPSNIYSNSLDMIYLDSDPQDPGESQEGIAQAMSRLIHHNYDPDEEEWVLTGIEQFAPYVAGYKTMPTDSLFTVNNNNSLLLGDYQRSIEYNQLFTLMDYIYEHYLYGDPFNPSAYPVRLISAIVQETATGTDGLDNVISAATDGVKDFNDLFVDWSLAIYFDNPDLAFNGGLYGFSNIDIGLSVSTYPWGTTSGNAPYYETIKNWAPKYVQSEKWILKTYENKWVDKAPNFNQETLIVNGTTANDFTLAVIKQRHKTAKDTSATITFVPFEVVDAAQSQAVYTDWYDFGSDVEVVVDSSELKKYQYFALVMISRDADDPAGGSFIVDDEDSYPTNPWNGDVLSADFTIDVPASLISVNLDWETHLGTPGGLLRETAPEGLTAHEFKERKYSGQTKKLPLRGMRIQDIAGFEGFNVYKEEVYENESSQEFFETGATTTHIFENIPQNGTINRGELEVKVIGNFFADEKTILYMEGVEVGNATAGFHQAYNYCNVGVNEHYDGDSFTIGSIEVEGEILNSVATDGQIVITSVNSEEVEVICDENSVQVTLRLYYNDQLISSLQSESNYTDVNVIEDKTYGYKVTAIFDGVESSPTNEVFPTTPNLETVSNLWTGVSNYGIYGDPAVPDGLPSMEWPGGSGVNYLWEGRLLVGALVEGEKRVSHAEYSQYEWHASQEGDIGQRPEDAITLLGVGALENETVYDDFEGPHTTTSLGIKVLEKIRMWSFEEKPELSNTQLIEVQLVKERGGDYFSGDVLNNVYISWVFDCDVGTGYDQSSPHIDDLVDYEGWDGPDSDTDLEDIVENLDLNGNGILDGYDEYGIPYGWRHLGSSTNLNPNYDLSLIVSDGYPDEFQVIIVENDTILVDRMMSYMYDGDDPVTPEDDTREGGGVPGFIGMRLLYSPTGSVNSHQWWNWEFDPARDRDKYDYMTGTHIGSRGYRFIPHPFKIGAPAFDYRFMLTTGPFFDFQIGDTIRIVTSVILGKGIMGLRQNADALALKADIVTESIYQEPVKIYEAYAPHNTESIGPFALMFRIEGNPGWDVEMESESGFIHYGIDGIQDSMALIETVYEGSPAYLGLVPKFPNVTGTTKLSYYISATFSDSIRRFWPADSYSAMIFGPDTSAPNIGEINDLENVHYLLPFDKIINVEVTDDRHNVNVLVNWQVGNHSIQSLILERENEISSIFKGVISGIIGNELDSVMYWVKAVDISSNENVTTTSKKVFYANDYETLGDWENGNMIYWDEKGYINSSPEFEEWGKYYVFFPPAPGTSYTMNYHRSLDLTRFKDAWITTPMWYMMGSVYNAGYFELSTDNLEWVVLDSFTGDFGLYSFDYSLAPFTNYDSVNIRFRYKRESSELSNWYIDDIIIHTDTTRLSEEKQKLIPEEFVLYQNYPNPFNPITTIRYDIPEAVDVELTVYDVLGREVVKLFNDTQDAGSYSVQWNGRNRYGKEVATGIYIYRLTAGDSHRTKKLILIK